MTTPTPADGGALPVPDFWMVECVPESDYDLEFFDEEKDARDRCDDIADELGEEARPTPVALYRQPPIVPTPAPSDAALREALARISLEAVNSAGSRDECGRIARAALSAAPVPTREVLGPAADPRQGILGPAEKPAPASAGDAEILRQAARIMHLRQSYPIAESLRDAAREMERPAAQGGES